MVGIPTHAKDGFLLLQIYIVVDGIVLHEVGVSVVLHVVSDAVFQLLHFIHLDIAILQCSLQQIQFPLMPFMALRCFF
jgi:hypothetical protein